MISKAIRTIVLPALEAICAVIGMVAFLYILLLFGYAMGYH